MILTQCAVCATELGLTLGKKCGRCSTRYCGAACQVQHWKEGGHKDLCKEIKRGGGAEKYHADAKFKEAVAVAVEKCADDTMNFAEALYTDPTASRADVLQAVAILEDVVRALRRVLGAHHPDTARALASLEGARMKREDVAA